MASPLTSTFKHLRGDDDCSVLPPPYATRPPTQSGNRKTGVRTAALFDSKCLNVLVNGDAIHTVAFRASEARSLAPGLSVARHDDQDTLIQGFAYQRAQWVRRRFPN